MLCMLKNTIIHCRVTVKHKNINTATKFLFFSMPIRDVSAKDNATIMLVVQHRKERQYFFPKRE